MADYIITSKRQSLAEVRQWDFDFTNDLPDGVTVSSATATHVPPSGNASTPTVGTISGNIVPVLLGPLSVTGWHELHVLATLSTGKSEIRLKIRVDF
jgi:hypothetical protein